MSRREWGIDPLEYDDSNRIGDDARPIYNCFNTVLQPSNGKIRLLRDVGCDTDNGHARKDFVQTMGFEIDHPGLAR